MENKLEQHIIKGMQMDLGVSKFSPEFAFENMNIRLTPRDDNTLAVATNERGNKECIIKDTDGNYSIINGQYVGSCIVNDSIIIFTQDIVSRIYKLTWINDNFISDLLYKGNLSFDTSCPLETLASYETETIQKVYFVDKINPPRFINIVASQEVRATWNDNSFNFVSTLNLKEEVEITKILSGGGQFQSGEIQYIITYYNLYGQESSIVYYSPLLYISPKDRGGNTDETFSNSFQLTINNFDSNFDYLRIYSYFVSSLNGAPSCKIVTDVPLRDLPAEATIVFTDNNTSGSSIDPTELLYKGGTELTASTLEAKDNTLFLGNIKLIQPVLSSSIRTLIKNNSTGAFVYKDTTIALGDPHIDRYSYVSTLNLNSQQIKHFKYLETYRFGIKLQNASGKWSEVVYIGDFKNDLRPNNSVSQYGTFSPVPAIADHTKKVPQFQLTLTSEVTSALLDLGYKKIQPVVVYPTLNDCDVLAQGIVCPTVFNIGDRVENSPAFQSSWFARPNLPKTHSDFRDPDSPTENYFTLTNSPAKIGSNIEFRHGAPIPDARYNSGEIQSQIGTDANPLIEYGYYTLDPTNFKSIFNDCYYVDQNVFTLHSPEFEFNDQFTNLDLSNLKFRIIGLSVVTSNVADIDITTNTSKRNYAATGFYRRKSNTGTPKYFGNKSLTSGFYWFDRSYNTGYFSNVSKQTGYVTYAWHRNGSLGDDPAATSSSSTRFGELNKKTISNVRFCYDNVYLESENVWNALREDTTRGISGMALFNTTEQQLVKIKAPENSQLEDIVYYGNVDKVIVPNLIRSNSGYPIIVNEGLQADISDVDTVINESNYSLNTEHIPYGKDAVRIAYKSSPHMVMALNYDSIIGDTYLYTANILPAFKRSDNYILNSRNASLLGKLFTSTNPSELNDIQQDTLEFSFTNDGITEYVDIAYPFFWIGELYRDNIINKFGGNSDIAILNNLWYNCGDSITLINEELSVPFTEGDTYYQRYDHLKTYAYDSSKANNIVDIVSFMCETKINLDGRYDKNRGLESNLTASPTNFNLLNKVYSQQNNFVTARTLDYTKFLNTEFKNTLTWSLTKTVAEEIDNWTNINLISTLDLDGDKGQLNKIVRLNNDLLTFQDKGIAKILFNDRIQINPSDNIPIEISNSGKVSGKYYIANNVGCVNKWSICSTNSGLYFIDDLNQDINLLGGEGITSLSDNLGFRKFIGDNTTLLEWTPSGFDNFITTYDKTNSDIYFTNSKYCLSYSELLKQFTSFFSYVNTKNMFNLNGKFFSVKPLESTVDIWSDNLCNNSYFFNYLANISTTQSAGEIWVNSEGLHISPTTLVEQTEEHSLPDIYNFDRYADVLYDKSDTFEIKIVAKHSDDTPANLPGLTFKVILEYVNGTSEFREWDTKYEEEYGFTTSLKIKKISIVGGPYNPTEQWNEDTNIIITSISIKKLISQSYDLNLWEQNAGDYNYYFKPKNISILNEDDYYKPYYTTIVSNEHPTYDKIFNTFEFRADSFSLTNTFSTKELVADTFDKLEVWNEYQFGTNYLLDTLNKSGTLKQKFRIWRALIPRDNVNGRNRIRNPWVYLKLSKNTPNKYKTYLHDIKVGYFI